MGHTIERQVSAGLILAESHPDDAFAFGNNLRAVDEHELLLMHPRTALSTPELLSECIEDSDQCWTILDNDRRILGFWGHGSWQLSDSESNEGFVWLLSGDELFQRFPKEMTRCARDTFFPILDKMYSSYGNLVLATNNVHVRWLASLGFKLHGRHSVGGESFLNLMRS